MTHYLTNLHDGSDELLHKVSLDETWPVMVNEVDHKAFDVRPVLILKSFVA